MAVFSDNLDGTPGALLSARTGWSRSVGVDDAPIAASGSGVRLPGGTGAPSTGTFHRPNTQPSSNDQYVKAILRNFGAPFTLGVRVDTNSATGQGYFLRRDNTSSLQVFRRSNAGAFTQIGSYSGSSTDLESLPVELRIVGSTITAYLNGVQIIGPITDSSIATGGIGTLTRGGSLGSATANVDDWESGDVSSGTTVTATNLTTAVPEIGTPAVTQVHALASGGLTTAGPAIGTPTVSQTHALTSAGLTTGTPEIGTPVITQVQALAANGLTTGGAEIGPAVLSEAQQLSADSLTTAAPEIGTPAVNTSVILTAESPSLAGPEIGTPDFIQVHGLQVDGLTVGSPEIGTPALNQLLELVALGLTPAVPEIGTPVLTDNGFVVIVEAEGLITAAPEIGTPVLLVMGLALDRTPAERTLKLKGPSRTLILNPRRKTMAAFELRWPSKRSSAVWDYALDFMYVLNRDGSPLVDNSDRIIESEAQTLEGDVVIRTVGHLTTQIVVWLEGGLGESVVRLTGKTALGRELDEQVKIRVLP